MLRATLIIALLALGACAHQPIYCEPHTCSNEQAWKQTKDPFGPYQITYGSIFGPQPPPGKITVE